MKRLYWRPSSVPRIALVLVALIAMAGLWAVEFLMVVEKQPDYDTKMKAARIAARAFEQIHVERIRLKLPIDEALDPALSGLIGPAMSPIVSNTGFLGSKHTSVNPNFAAVVVDMLTRAGAKRGDPVAVGVSGSFPAINACAYAAIEAMGLQAVVIASVAASQFGASDPQLTWLDMERVLLEQGIVSFRSIATSRGGIQDRGDGHTPEGIQMLDDAMARAGLPMLRPETLEEAVSLRLATYAKYAGEDAFAAYVNIGGGTASVGTSVGKHAFKEGLNLGPPRGLEQPGVMRHFARLGVPVIHLVNIKHLAERYGLPLEPTTVPKPGVGEVFFRAQYNQLLAWVVLIVILVLLYGTIRMDIGSRVLKSGDSHQTTRPPEQMV